MQSESRSSFCTVIEREERTLGMFGNGSRVFSLYKVARGMFTVFPYTLDLENPFPYFSAN